MADNGTNTIEERAQAVVDDFTLFDDWMGRYEYIIDIGKNLPPMDDAHKNDDTRIHGCQSKVWIRTVLNANQMHLEGDSDAMITKGLAGLLIRVLDGQPPEAIRDTDLGFIDEIGMREHLSSTRNNGLHAMIEQIRNRADQHVRKTNPAADA
ncbi:MAG: SufE family protein [Longimonas sp.]|uniref:SufE family protein n=1 Tax=Longimonas sp. TaxID=2039626 RepID=UPI0033466354